MAKISPINKGNFFLIFFTLFISFEFLALMAYVISRQAFSQEASLDNYKTMMMQIILFAFISYSLVKKK
ncbi:MAG: hypothetical protein PHT91_00045 [Candidatus Nanoarchaeia archaeon]|nr:hypothetical protein [Candidatus Nanoarchaeia archaeon]MDD5054145.1 hypothetical protein [Candidatus Nanoarchaeia archaeon]MDD5499254.1 hypothetical protein [Candidatus Nanoarchaeia archaeon]